MSVPSRHTWVWVAAIGVALFAAVWLLPPLFVGESETAAEARRHKSTNDVRVALLQALGGTFLAAGLYFTARTFELSRQGQLSERFSDGIDQLGNHESVTARIGGVYVLERLAQLSPELARSVVPILDGFVHEHAPWPPKEEQPTRVPGDVEAAVKVLTRVAPLIKLPGFGPRSPDLSNLDLRQGNFDTVNFGGAVLRDTNFDGASLVLAKFRDAKLQGGSTSMKLEVPARVFS